MEEIKYPSNAEVFIHELQNPQLGKEVDITRRQIDFLSSGVVEIPTGTISGQSQNFVLGGGGTALLSVGYISGSESGGVGYLKDANGNMQRVAFTVNKSWIGGVDPTAPDTIFTPGAGIEPKDPYGNWLQQSSGNYNIPVPAPSTTYYVFIDYLQVVDASGFTVEDKEPSPKVWYTRYQDGYVLSIQTVNTWAGHPNALYLGSFVSDGAGNIDASTIDQSGRILCRQRGITLSGTTSSTDTDVTATYTYGQDVTYVEHIKAKGSAALSQTNPHGIALIDLGVGPDANVSTHQQLLHATGLMNGDPSSVLLSMYPYISGVHLKIKPLDTVGAVTTQLIVQSVSYTASSALTVYDPYGASTAVKFDFADLVGSEYDSGAFSGTLASGVYYFYIDVSSPAFPTLSVLKSATLPVNSNYYIICSVYWDGVNLRKYNLGPIGQVMDYRVYRNVTALPMWKTEARREAKGSVGFNLTTSFLETFDGTNWNYLPPRVWNDATIHTGSTTYDLPHNLDSTPDFVFVTLQVPGTGTAWERLPADGNQVHIETDNISTAFKVMAWKITA